MFENTVVVDCRGHLLGRLCSIIAKELMSGQRVVLVRCEEMNISGRYAPASSSARPLLSRCSICGALTVIFSSLLLFSMLYLKDVHFRFSICTHVSSNTQLHPQQASVHVHLEEEEQHQPCPWPVSLPFAFAHGVAHYPCDDAAQDRALPGCPRAPQGAFICTYQHVCLWNSSPEQTWSNEAYSSRGRKRPIMKLQGCPRYEKRQKEGEHNMIRFGHVYVQCSADPIVSVI